MFQAFQPIRTTQSLAYSSNQAIVYRPLNYEAYIVAYLYTIDI